MPTSYKDHLVDIAPPWLRSAVGEAFQRGIGDVKDSLLARAKEAVKARFPLIAPSDALHQTGGERQLPRAPGETDATYATRVRGAWDVWPWAGTAYGTLVALRDAGYPGVSLIISKGMEYALDSGTGELIINDLGYATFDSYWSRFWVYFSPAAFPSGWAGTPPSVSSNEGKFILGLVKKWKSAHARFDRVVFQGTGAMWGTVPWGSVTWGGTNTIWEGPFS